MLTRLLETSADPTILAVAAHDTGEYVRHHPRGKQYVVFLFVCFASSYRTESFLQMSCVYSLNLCFLLFQVCLRILVVRSW